MNIDGDLPVAIVGGGLAGSYCAHLLAKAGKKVVLYDMGRNVGKLGSIKKLVNHIFKEMLWAMRGLYRRLKYIVSTAGSVAQWIARRSSNPKVAVSSTAVAICLFAQRQSS